MGVRAAPYGGPYGVKCESYPRRSSFSSASRFRASMGDRTFTSVISSFFSTVCPPRSSRETLPLGRGCGGGGGLSGLQFL